jgi:hypothetical protein
MRTFPKQSSSEMSKRLKTTGMGLGLVRLLQDSGRTEEARTTLASLENGFQSVAEDKPNQKTCKASRLKCGSNSGGQAGPKLVIFNPAGDTGTEAALGR